MSSDVGTLIEGMLREGLEKPESQQKDVRALLTRVVEVVRAGAARRGDTETVALLDRDAEAFMTQTKQVRARLSGSTGSSNPTTNAADPDTPSGRSASGQEKPALAVVSTGIHPAPVLPTPVFHERPVAVVEGFVRTRDIQLWDENQRLDIHLSQFHQQYGRGPDAEELVAIMKGHDAPAGDRGGPTSFAIQALARSVGGQWCTETSHRRRGRESSWTGTGGSRPATTSWRTTTVSLSPRRSGRGGMVEGLANSPSTRRTKDREAVIVSLNFEPDHKEPWPEYVKASEGP